MCAPVRDCACWISPLPPIAMWSVSELLPTGMHEMMEIQSAMRRLAQVERDGETPTTI